MNIAKNMHDKIINCQEYFIFLSKVSGVDTDVVCFYLSIAYICFGDLDLQYILKFLMLYNFRKGI